jgi:uncharacterized protein
MNDAEPSFEWDEAKDRSNVEKHGIDFAMAQRAFMDGNRVIADDISHSEVEKRYFCIGNVDGEILTVRFTWRDKKFGFLAQGIGVKEN